MSVILTKETEIKTIGSGLTFVRTLICFDDLDKPQYEVGRED